MKLWWVLSVILITLMLAVLVLARSMPFVLRAISMVSLVLWAIALIYFVVRRW
jgi:hypothetical protein